ncbi:Histone-lysine N-methyltransferase [Rhynchospora pubera]|uniref:Histone-lysine N-methyltransferase n=1 Tax=Rhynchospora pubera TaxID=906938 RepID=A0AAV8DGU4_9POAL|nr:Histone-lysine N-methyltransferase [Rhynchospora pubera]
MMLIKRDSRTQITSLKRCKAEGPASPSGDGPMAGVDEPFKKKMRQDTVQLAPATSACGAGVQVEAVGRSTRTRARVVPSRFKDSVLVDGDNKEKSSSKSVSGIDSGENAGKSSNANMDLVPKSSKSKSLMPKYVNNSENEESRMEERVLGSKKRDEQSLLEELEIGEVIWAKSSKASPPWPAIVIEPREHAPEVVLNALVPGAVCVMYFGHSANGNRDYGWVKAGMIFPFLDNVDRFQGQKLGKLKARFVDAIEEAFLAYHGFFELGSYSEGPECSEPADMAPVSSDGDHVSSNDGNRTCKGCGRSISLTKNKKSEFDQSLCIACRKLYKERRYCGVCERVWYDTDGGSFIQCDGCEIWVHSECIKTHTEEELKNIKYFCPACMAKGKMKTASVTPSHVDNNRCEEKTLEVELKDTIPVYLEQYEGLYLRSEHMILCNCNQCNGTKLTPARFESHTGSRRKNWKIIVKVKGTDMKLDDLLNGKKPCVVKSTQRSAPITMKQKVEELLQEPYMPVHARWITERCAICRWIEDWDYNKIIICNRCQVAVHQECYGATDVNDLTSWVCRACEDPKLKRNCCLCPIKGGALKRTDVGDFWVHVTCTWFQPKMTFPNPNTMEPAVGILSVPLDSFKKMCVICEQVHGACTKCCECNVSYHAMCASRAGYRMELHTYVSHGKQISRFDSYCPNHGRASKNNALVLLTKDEVFSSMRSETNNAKVSCSRLVRRDMEMQSTTCQEVDLPSTSSEEACARCRVYQKKDNKRRTREEAVPHRTMGPRQHSLEAIESLNVHPKELDPKNFSTFDERLQYLKKNENHRVCRGKSGIHGWGLFARRPIQGGEMIIEYRGERIRCSVSDAREARYRAENKDCYLFRISEEFVLDATRKGNVARLINHSCQPNCYARIVTLNETNRIVFVAKEDIPAGQELTFDYMFNTDESDENRVKCLCQAPNCRGYMA